MTAKEVLLNLVQIGLTVSAAALVLFVLRKALKKRYPARAICFVWALLAIRLLIPVQLTLPDAPVQVTPRTTYLSNVEFSAEAIESASLPVYEHDGRTTTARWVTNDEASALRQALGGPGYFSTFDLGRVLFLLWIAGAALYVVWQGYQYHYYRYVLEHSSHPAERDTLRRVFEEQKQSLGIRRDIPLVVTAAADCPMLAGFLKPALYLPDEALSGQEAMFIFRHELTHYKRGDLWLKLLLTAAKAVHWFNPLVYLMARFAQEDIELACDDAVVRGMDGAQRRAYGETILKSAAAQVKKRALVSCFTGDKETLMRRFEGLFDTRAKKRGVALIVAVAVLVGSLGCAVSVGESKDGLTDEQIVQLGEQWMSGNYRDAEPWYQMLTDDLAQELYDQLAGETGEPVWEVGTSSPVVSRYTVIPDAENEQAVIVMEWTASGSIPTRQAERIHFTQVGGVWKVDRVEGNSYINDTPFVDTVDSLDDFRLLYENDLGLPDFLTALETNPDIDISTPEQAVVNLLHLDVIGYMGGSSPEGIDETRDMWDITFTFDDGSEVKITMVNQFDAGWLPQDFTYENGTNNRTAADLAQQYARGVQHKSGQFVYPILSEELRADFITQQQGISGDGNWYWKYGGSSPSFRDLVIVPTEDENTYTAVFQMYGGGATDYRSAVNITVGTENGRQVITAIDRCDEHLSFMLDQMSGQDTGYTQSELFGLYYDSGLAWPSIPEGATSFNGAQLDELTTPLDAVEAVFGYLGDYVEQTEGNVHHIRLERWFTAELVSQTDTGAVVRLNFTDGSPSVNVRMERTGDYWLPVGLAEQFDDGFTATAGEVALPVGATVQEAVQNADGNIPLLNVGDTIDLLFDPAPQGEVTISDSVIREDGTLQYSARETQTGTFAYTGIVASMSYSYSVERLPAELLASTLSPYIYRGVTVSYTSADGTAYSNAFVFRLAGTDIQTDYTITSTTYHNATYGYILTLPDCFVGQGYVKEDNGVVTFGMKDAWPGEVSDPYGAGAVMTLAVGAAAELRDVFGEDWAENYLVPCRELAVQNGLAYMLLFASDVQYDPQDETITAAYAEMRQAAEAMDGSAISFDGQSDAQRKNERTTVLQELATYYISREGYIGSADVIPDEAENACTIVWTADPGGASGAQGRPRRAARIWFEDLDDIQPARTELLADSGDGVDSLETFLLLYDNGLALPELAKFEVRALLADNSITALRDPVQAAEWTLGLAGGAVDNRRANGERGEEIFRYTWADGSRVSLVMKGVQLGDAAQPIYLPIRWNAETAGGSGWAYDPYTYMMCKENNDFSDCSAEELAYYLTRSDGAYTENILHELDLRWQDDPEGVDWLMEAQEASISSLWESHKAANPDIFGARFSEDEIKAAYQAVRDYAAANGFSVENLRYDAASEHAWSEGIMENGVLRDNVQQDGLTIDDVITVLGDAREVSGTQDGRADGWSFTLYRGADGRWVLEDGAFGY